MIWPVISCLFIACALAEDSEGLLQVLNEDDTEATLDAKIQNHDKVLVLYCTAWQPDCKNVGSIFTSLAKAFQDTNTLILSVDCKVSKKVCRAKRVKRVPRIVLYSYPDEEEYTGARVVSDLLAFVKGDRDAIAESEVVYTINPANHQEEIQAFGGETFLLYINQASGDSANSESARARARFYEAASSTKVQGKSFAILNCAGAKDPCQVDQFPLIAFYREYVPMFSYGGLYTLAGVSEFIERPTPYLPPLAERQEWVPLFTKEDEGERFKIISDGSLRQYLEREDSSRNTLVFFHDPWTIGSTGVKGPLLAAVTATDSGTTAASVDCSLIDNRDLCLSVGIQSMPQAIYFVGHEIKHQPFSGDYSEDRLAMYLNDPDSLPPPKVYVEPFLMNAGVQDPRSKFVTILGDSNFQPFIKDNERVLVFFYAPWCGFCKEAKPDYAKLAEIASERVEYGVVAAVDCTAAGAQTCGHEKANSFPTIKYYHNGISTLYQGNRDLPHLTRFLHAKANQGGTVPVREPKRPARRPDRREKISEEEIKAEIKRREERRAEKQKSEL